MPDQQSNNFDKAIEVLKSAKGAILRTDFERAFKALATAVQAIEKRLMGRIDARLTTLKDGINGKDGKSGRDGRDGTRGPMGSMGLPGPQGPQGYSGRDGKDGKDGRDGNDGKDGKNGETRYITAGWGAHPLTIKGLGVLVDKNTRSINFTGSAVNSVTRGADGTVTVNLSAAAGSDTIVDQEVPNDSGDHIHFTIAHTPITGTFKLYRGGSKQGSIGTTPDYTLTGTALTLTTALNTAQGEQLLCDYSY